MTAAFVFKRISHSRGAFTNDTRLQSTRERSYCKVYQLKLQQWLINPHIQQRPERKSSKYLNKESMNNPLEKNKSSSLLNDQQSSKRSKNLLSINNFRTKETLKPTEVLTVNMISPCESRPKSILKTTKQSSSTTKHPRIISAPANSQRNIRRKAPVIIPTIEIDHSDEHLPKSNGHSYTNVSSSTQNSIEITNQYARKSALNGIILHLHSFRSPDLSLWNLYREFDEKFSTSISPRVYRNFERIIL